MIGLVAMRIERMKVAEFGMRWLQGVWCLVLAMKISRTTNPRFASGHLDKWLLGCAAEASVDARLQAGAFWMSRRNT